MTRPVIALAALAAAFAAPAAANDLWPDRPEPAPAIAVAEDSQPHAVDGVLYWTDHRPAAVCAATGGAFGKLPNSAVYACVPAE
jgi:hypothetical protein